MGALGVHGIGGDDRPGNVYAVQQRGEHGDLVRLRGHVSLSQDRAAGVVESRQQVTAVFIAMAGAA
jgi:hypothetical protein